MEADALLAWGGGRAFLKGVGAISFMSFYSSLMSGPGRW